MVVKVYLFRREKGPQMPHIFAAISLPRHATYKVICIPMNGICEVVAVFPVTSSEAEPEAAASGL
jgi:hypothetical protein